VPVRLVVFAFAEEGDQPLADRLQPADFQLAIDAIDLADRVGDQIFITDVDDLVGGEAIRRRWAGYIDKYGYTAELG